MPLRICAVSFTDVRGIRHTVEVQAESLFEAAILGVRAFRGDPWIEHVGPATVLDIEVRGRRNRSEVRREVSGRVGSVRGSFPFLRCAARRRSELRAGLYRSASAPLLVGVSLRDPLAAPYPARRAASIDPARARWNDETTA